MANDLTLVNGNVRHFSRIEDLWVEIGWRDEGCALSRMQGRSILRPHGFRHALAGGRTDELGLTTVGIFRLLSGVVGEFYSSVSWDS